MRLPPRAIKCLKYLDSIEASLEYFMEAGVEFKALKNNEIKYLRDYIKELSESKKLNEIKLATKIKKDLE